MTDAMWQSAKSVWKPLDQCGTREKWCGSLATCQRTSCETYACMHGKRRTFSGNCCILDGHLPSVWHRRIQLLLRLLRPRNIPHRLRWNLSSIHLTYGCVEHFFPNHSTTIRRWSYRNRRSCWRKLHWLLMIHSQSNYWHRCSGSQRLIPPARCGQSWWRSASACKSKQHHLLLSLIGKGNFERLICSIGSRLNVEF